MDANLKKLYQEVEQFKNLLGSYEFAPQSDSAKKTLILKSEKFPRATDRAALLNLVKKKLLDSNKSYNPFLKTNNQYLDEQEIYFNIRNIFIH